MRAVFPVIDPLAQKAAIDALEAQRSAYQRYARDVETQRQSLGDGDGDRAVAAAAIAANGLDALQEGARAVRPTVDRAAGAAGPDQLRDLQQRMDGMMREAHAAESAIHNLTAQLQAWRDAYGRQLSDVGLTPGSTGGAASNANASGAEPASSTTGATTAAAGTSGYGRKGRGADRRPGPSLIDRRG